jgi:putative endonuclease
MEKQYYLYMMTNKYNNVLYVGVTNDIKRRVLEHRQGAVDGFTKKYNCHKLVWFEQFIDIRLAIEKEKMIKNWRREYKNNLINAMNPQWDDLYELM